MVALITAPGGLIPIPDNTGNPEANPQLAQLISLYCPGAAVILLDAARVMFWPRVSHKW